MPLIDVSCAQGHFTEINRPLAMYPHTPACPECGAATNQELLPPRIRWTPDPVIVFQAADGSMRFPGDPSGISAESYRRQGMTEIAIRNASEMRRFEQHMNTHERSRAERALEFRERQRETMEHQNRSELNRRMQSMSRMGREVARVAMARTDNRPRRHTQDPGFHSDVYNNGRSNREDSRDSSGRRRRD